MTIISTQGHLTDEELASKRARQVCATRCPTIVDLANSVASGPQQPTVYPGFFVSGVSMPKRRTRRRPRTSSRMSMVSPSTTFKTVAVTVAGSAAAVGSETENATATTTIAALIARLARWLPVGAGVGVWTRVDVTRSASRLASDAVVVAISGGPVVRVALGDIPSTVLVGLRAVAVRSICNCCWRGADGRRCRDSTRDDQCTNHLLP